MGRVAHLGSSSSHRKDVGTKGQGQGLKAAKSILCHLMSVFMGAGGTVCRPGASRHLDSLLPCHGEGNRGTEKRKGLIVVEPLPAAELGLDRKPPQGKRGRVRPSGARAHVQHLCRSHRRAATGERQQLTPRKTFLRDPGATGRRPLLRALCRGFCLAHPKGGPGGGGGILCCESRLQWRLPCVCHGAGVTDPRARPVVPRAWSPSASPQAPPSCHHLPGMLPPHPGGLGCSF